MRARFLPALALMACAVPAFGQNDRAMSLVGKKMPAFAFTDLQGKRIDNASLRGKPVLLDFWASWCSACRAASKDVQAVKNQFSGKGLQVIAVNGKELQPAQNRPKSAEYQKKHGWTYRFATSDDATLRRLGVEALPVFIVIDRTGVVRNVFTKWDKAAVEAAVRRVL